MADPAAAASEFRRTLRRALRRDLRRGWAPGGGSGEQRPAECPQWVYRDGGSSVTEVVAELRGLADASRPPPPQLLGQLARKLDNWGPFALQQCAAALYGLHRLPCSGGTRAVVGVLGLRGVRWRRSGSADVARALYGLQRQSGSAEVRMLLREVALALRRCEPMDALGVGMSLYGLQLQDPAPELELLLQELARLIAEGADPLPPSNLAAALRGMQRFTTDSPAALSVLRAVTLRMPCGGEAAQLTPRQLSTMLYGMQGFRGAPAVRRFLAALLPLAADCSGESGALTVSAALYGFKSRDGHPTPEEDAVLGAAARQLLAPCRELDGDAVSAGLYGTSGMRHDDPATAPGLEGMLLAFAPLIWSCPEPLSGKHLGMALYGLRRKSATPAVRSVLLALLPLRPRAGSVDAQAVSSALVGLDSQGDTAEARLTLRAVAQAVAADSTLLDDVGEVIALQRLLLSEGPAVRAVLGALLPRMRSAPAGARRTLRIPAPPLGGGGAGDVGRTPPPPGVWGRARG